MSSSTKFFLMTIGILVCALSAGFSLNEAGMAFVEYTGLSPLQ